MPTKSIALTECPKCGSPKLAKSVICSNCYAANTALRRAKGHLYEPCPKCGQDKDVRAKTCRRCYGIRSTKHPNPRNFAPRPNLGIVTQEWLLEFRGFFLGEGTAGLNFCKGSTNGLHSVTVELTVTQRADNLPYIQEIANHMGGNVRLAKEKGKNQMCYWHLSGLDNCLTVLELLYDPTNLHRKMEDIALCIEFIKWRKAQPLRLTPETRATAKDYVYRLRSIRDFKVEGQSSLSLAL